MQLQVQFKFGSSLPVTSAVTQNDEDRRIRVGVWSSATVHITSFMRNQAERKIRTACGRTLRWHSLPGYEYVFRPLRPILLVDRRDLENEIMYTETQTVGERGIGLQLCRIAHLMLEFVLVYIMLGCG